jgi:putative DNA methylase
MSTRKKKLIEVALPLEAINKESAREKSIRQGHPSTLHLWWARRPLAACRAVLFAQIVDDPSAHPNEFPTDEAQRNERDRLFAIIEELVKWENVSNERVLGAARAEIMKSCDGKPPPVLDPFAGGGSIPLEAQRLGLEVHASDLNPVAVLINKALIEVPPRWAGHPPVWPGADDERLTSQWPGVTGLAEDVRRYGKWMHDEAQERLGYLYPDVKLSDGSKAKVIAWVWARTVTCPNPACRAQIPLISTYWLSKKRDRPTWLQPVVEGKNVRFEVRTGRGAPEHPPKLGRGGVFACLVCATPTTDAYVKSEATSGRMSEQLLATVAEGSRQRVYCPASEDQIRAAAIERPGDLPEGTMSTNPRWFSPPAFGLTEFSDLFTNRQLAALMTFSDLVQAAHTKVIDDADTAGLGEADATTYADAIALYLSFVVDRLANESSTLSSWDSNGTKQHVRATFSRQALGMTWDFAEPNPFFVSTGSLSESVRRVADVVTLLPTGRSSSTATQANATEIECPPSVVVSTDPPYYDNIGYADLSDFFYVWLRRSLGWIHADVTTTMLTPKVEELIATPHRFSGSVAAAREYFESGLNKAFHRIRTNQDGKYPVAIFYAFKQSESDEEGLASTGWETMLSGLIDSGLAITATWPMRSERGGRMISIGTNALASAIVLSCRPREVEAPTVMRSGFVAALQAELPSALRDLQQGAIAPVDLPQAAIGPGMAIFSRYGRVLESDGSPMRVRMALALINQVLDEVLHEQEGDFDPDTRWCVSWFEQYGFSPGKFGDADNMARARDTSVDGLHRAGVVRRGGGKVTLLHFDDLDPAYDPITDDRPTVWEGVMHLARLLSSEGVDSAAAFLRRAAARLDLDAVKELGYLLFSICDRKKWTESAGVFNGVVTSWLDLQDAMRAQPAGTQGTLSFDEGE